MKTIIILLTLSFKVSHADTFLDIMCRKHHAPDCELVKAISWVESRHRNLHTDDVGSVSYGPMQIKCDTAKVMGLKYGCAQLRRRSISIRFAIRYIKFQLIRYKHDKLKAIAAYNSGSVIICKDYNPGKCYPGEFYNHKYVSDVWRRYKWLRKMKRLPVSRYSRLQRKLGTLENCLTDFRLDSPISWELITDSHLD